MISGCSEEGSWRRASMRSALARHAAEGRAPESSAFDAVFESRALSDGGYARLLQLRDRSRPEPDDGGRALVPRPRSPLWCPPPVDDAPTAAPPLRLAARRRGLPVVGRRAGRRAPRRRR